MRRLDVPGTFRIEQTRAVVQAIEGGADSSLLVGEKTGLSTRHVSFALASGRILGWLRGGGGSWQVTTLGDELLRSDEGSLEEARLVERSISGSTTVQKLAPNLLTDDTHDAESLTTRIVKLTGRSETSARRGARVLLSWRRQTLDMLQIHQGESGIEKAKKKRKQPSPRDPLLHLVALRLERFGPFLEAQADLQPFSVFVGGSGTGKSAFIDAVAFLGKCLSQGVEMAVAERMHSRINGAQSSSFGIAVEMRLPEELRPERNLARVRYEVVIEVGDVETPIQWETLFLRPEGGRVTRVRTSDEQVPKSWLQVLRHDSDGRVRYRSERDSGELTFELDRACLALSALPEDHSHFPASLAFRAFLKRGIRRLDIQTAGLRSPFTPRAPKTLQSDGGNLPVVVEKLLRSEPTRFKQWVEQVQEALPEVRDITVAERPEDRHLFLEIHLKDETVLPHYLLSDSTLRILVFTLVPFDSSARTLWVIDEATQGIPPVSVAALSRCWAKSGDAAPLLVMTASPLWARVVKLDNLICFLNDDPTNIEIVPGRRCEKLKVWRAEIELSTFVEAFPFTPSVRSSG